MHEYCEWRAQQRLRHPPVTDERRQRLLLRIMAELALTMHTALVEADHPALSESYINARLASLFLLKYICLGTRTRPCTTAGLVKLTGYPLTTVKRYLESLLERELIEKTGRGWIVSAGFLRSCCTRRRFNRFHHTLVTACAMLDKYI